MQMTLEQALQRAVEAHKAGKLQDAESLYRAILQSQPKHPDANHNLGVMAVSLNKTEAALPLFKTALEANPNQGQFWLSYIDALIKEKQLDIAKVVLEEGKKRGLAGEMVDALEAQLAQLDINLKNQKTETSKLSKAIELRETGRYQEAQDWLTKFLEVESNDAEGWSLLSQLFLLDKKDVQAEKALATAISINPNLPSIYRNQARLLLKKSNPAEALLKAHSGYEQSTEDPESWIVLAACLGANQRDVEALPLAERALKVRPNYAEAFANRAMIRLRAKNTSGAIEDLEIAGKLKPHLTQIWELLGTLRYQNKNLSGAIEALKKAQALEPDNVSFMINLGEFLRQDQRIEEAIAILEKATEKAPENANAWVNLGAVLQQDNKIDKAQAAYKKALAINPNSAEITCNLGAIAKGSGNYESALKYFEKAIAIKPDLAEAHYNLGKTLNELDRLKDAESSYIKAISIKPDYAEAHYNLGTTLKELGRLKDAEASFINAIDIKPEYDKKLSHVIASFRGQNPKRATDSYVSSLFDDFAKNFESSLVGNLKYETPTIIANFLRPLISSENPNFDILDLGCGTGLAGEALLGLAKTLVGIDLSKEMLKIAKAKNIYDRLIQDEIHHALSQERSGSFDLVVSSDVFVYIGDIKAIFDQVYDVLKVGGFFAYSTEALYPASNGKEEVLPDYKLNINGRYSHSSEYLLGLIDASQFSLHIKETAQIRLEKGQPVMGYVVIMQKNKSNIDP